MTELAASLFGFPGLPLLLGLCALVFAGSVVQTATGFGFAIVCAPVGAALLGGPAAVGMVLVTGTAVDLMVMLLRRQLPRPRWDEVGVLGLSSLPGLAVGAYLLATVSQRVLLLVIAVAVLVAVVLRVVTRRVALRQTALGGSPGVPGRWWGVVAGLTSGALATSTTLAGPPSVLYLGLRGHPPLAVRDSLVALNLVRLPLSVAALAVGGVFVLVPGTGWLVLATLAGYAVGVRVFRSLDVARFEVAVLAVLLLAALSAVLAAVTG